MYVTLVHLDLFLHTKWNIYIVVVYMYANLEYLLMAFCALYVLTIIYLQKLCLSSFISVFGCGFSQSNINIIVYTQLLPH